MLRASFKFTYIYFNYRFIILNDIYRYVNNLYNFRVIFFAETSKTP